MSSAEHPAAPRLVDVRGPRFAATVTTIVLASAFLLQARWLVAVQALVFAIGAAAGLRRAPYGLLFGVVRDLARLGPARRTEAEAPPRFAQLLGAIMAALALLSFAAGLGVLGWGLVLAALAAALLNATTGFCLGCELYLLGRRLGGRAA